MEAIRMALGKPIVRGELFHIFSFFQIADSLTFSVGTEDMELMEATLKTAMKS